MRIAVRPLPLFAALLLAGAGHAQMMPGEPPASALSRYLRVLAASPNDVQALAGAGQAALASGDANSAVGFLGRADQASPRDGRIKASLGSALVQVEQPAQALRMFEQAASLGVPESQFAADRGLAYDLTGENRRAQQSYRLALAAGANDEATRRLALSTAIGGDRAGALALLDPLMRRQDKAAWRASAFVLALTGDPQAAEARAALLLPRNQALMMAPYFERLPSLDPAAKALAVHFGRFPSPGGRRQEPQVAQVMPVPSPQPSWRSSKPAPEPLRLRPFPKPAQVASAAPATSAPQPPPVVVATVEPPRSRPVQSPPMMATPPQAAPSLSTGLPATGSAMAGASVGPVLAQPATGATTALGESPGGTTVPVQPPPVPASTEIASAAPTTPIPPPAIAPEPRAAVVAATPPRLSPEPLRLKNREEIAAETTDASAPAKVPSRRGARPSAQLALDTPADAAETATDTVSDVAIVPKLRGRPAPQVVQLALDTQPDEVVAEAAPAVTAARLPGRGRSKPVALALDATDDRPDADAPKSSALKLASLRGSSKPVRLSLDATADDDAPASASRKDKAAAKAKADQAKADADAKASAKKEPSRYWVQVATGANKADLPKAWNQIRGKYSSRLGGKSAWTTPLRFTNRLLVGPFPSADAAQDFVNQGAKAGMNASTFTSPAGQAIERVGG